MFPPEPPPPNVPAPVLPVPPGVCCCGVWFGCVLGSRPNPEPTGSRLNGKNQALGWKNSPVPAGWLKSNWSGQSEVPFWGCPCAPLAGMERLALSVELGSTPA